MSTITSHGRYSNFVRMGGFRKRRPDGYKVESYLKQAKLERAVLQVLRTDRELGKTDFENALCHITDFIRNFTLLELDETFERFSKMGVVKALLEYSGRQTSKIVTEILGKYENTSWSTR